MYMCIYIYMNMYVCIYTYIYKKFDKYAYCIEKGGFSRPERYGEPISTAIKQTYLRTVKLEYQIYRGKLEGPQDIPEPTPHWLDNGVSWGNGKCLLSVRGFGFCDTQHDSFVTMYFHEVPGQKFGAAHFHVFRHLHQSLYGRYIIHTLRSVCGSKLRNELYISYGARAMLPIKFRPQ